MNHLLNIINHKTRKVSRLFHSHLLALFEIFEITDFPNLSYTLTREILTMSVADPDLQGGTLR